MAEIKYEDEDDLQRKIKKILNKQGFHFEIVPHIFDLVDKYKKCSIGEKTISDVFNELKDEPNIDNIDENYRIMIKKEIEKRLEIIGYWDYIPIPKSI